jgi:hypothetical protein
MDEVLNQQRNVFPSFAERRHLDRKNIEPVIQVTPKRTPSDGRLQVSIRGGNHPDIRLDGFSSTNTLKFMFLQNTQESDLGLGSQLSDLIEEERSPSGQFKAAQTLLGGPCKGPLLVAEQF